MYVANLFCKKQTPGRTKDPLCEKQVPGRTKNLLKQKADVSQSNSDLILLIIVFSQFESA